MGTSSGHKCLILRTRDRFLGLIALEIGDAVEPTSGHVSVIMMHLVEGLKFRAVAVIACNDAISPLRERIENMSDNADLEEVYNTERQQFGPLLTSNYQGHSLRNRF